MQYQQPPDQNQQQGNYPQQYPQQYPQMNQPPVQGIPMGSPQQPYMAHNMQGGFPQAYPNNNGMPVVVQPLQQVQVRHNAKGCDFPCDVQCKYCKAVSRTNIRYKMGTQSWLVCVLCTVLLPPLCLIPMCCDQCKDKIHHCGACGKKVGKRKYKLC